MTGGNGPLFTAIGAVLAAIIAGAWAWKNSGRATMSGEQRAWLQEAMKETRQARTDLATAEQALRVATTAAGKATQTADSARAQVSEVLLLLEGMVRWTDRVVSAGQDPAVSDQEVRRIVNGGPPGLTNAKLQVQTAADRTQ